MTCSDIEELLLEYANDELSEEQQKFVKEHILNCLGCRHELEQFINVRQQLQSLREMHTVNDIEKQYLEKTMDI